MQRREILSLSLVAVIVAIFSFILASALFGAPARRGTKVPVVQSIGTSFPDVKNDPNYNFFLNDKALDPTQPIQIGGSQNNTPFNSGQ